MKNFGTLEYVLDNYSKTWSWKVTGSRAVSMVSKLIPGSWYGEGPNEAIIPDSSENVKHLKWILERYPLDILSKSVWQRKSTISKRPKIILPKTEKLVRVNPGEQFRGKLLNFQKEGLDFLLKSSGYLSKIHFRCFTFSELSGTIASFGPSPYQDSGISFDTIETARDPVTFQLHVFE